jgi:virginiamycin B lyase
MLRIPYGGVVGVLVAALVTVSASASPEHVLPVFLVNPVPLQRSAAPDKRGIVTLFDDKIGDAVPEGITAGPDGAVWFTDAGNDAIGRVTPSGHLTEFSVGKIELENGITTGPDGALWFTSFDSIGRITTSGNVTLFADSGGSFPQIITTGPDGALWFTESNGKLGRITTSGTLSHVHVASTNIELEGIVSGPDGRLWATEFITNGSHFANNVVAVTTSGKVTRYQVGSGPGFITVGPDGALWFTEEDSDAIGRLTTAGQYSEFPIAKQISQPSGIATGPDGAIWFTGFEGGGIGRLTPAGRMTFYAVPGGSPEVQQITTGPRDAMWFTCAMSPAAIGRITTH